MKIYRNSFGDLMIFGKDGVWKGTVWKGKEGWKAVIGAIYYVWEGDLGFRPIDIGEKGPPNGKG